VTVRAAAIAYRGGMTMAGAVACVLLAVAGDLSRAADATSAPRVAPAQNAVAVPAFTRTVLPNGVTLVTMARRDVPLLAFAALVRGGAWTDPAGKAGVASITAGLLEKGAGSRSAFQFADTVEGAGGSFTASAATEATTVGGQFLAKDADLVVELLADALQRPRFDADEFAKLRDRQIEFIKAAKDSDPSELIRTYGRAFLFGRNTFGSPTAGSERSLATITHDDVLAHYAAQYGADRLTLIFVGDLDVASMTAAVQKAFGGWRRAGAPLAALTPTARVSGRRVLLVDQPDAAQTHFWLANVGVARTFPDRAPLDVVNTLFGGRFTSILNTELRIKSGLSYGAASGFSRGSVPGEFAIRSFTQTSTTREAIDLALATLAGLHEQGIDASMLDSGRAYVLGQYPLRFETSPDWAAALAELELYGLDQSYISGFGPAVARVGEVDAKRVIGEAFPVPDNLIMVFIGDAAKIRPVVSQYGPVTELALSAPSFSP
jgi:predicted Zn-dependent peptidase